MKKTRLPRKLKKKISKIPMGSLCYGVSKRDIKAFMKFKIGLRYCPFYSDLKSDGKFAYCGFLNLKSDGLLSGEAKECER